MGNEVFRLLQSDEDQKKRRQLSIRPSECPGKKTKKVSDFIRENLTLKLSDILCNRK